MKKNNQTITIFGGTGDLTYRKLLPAFYNLMVTKELPDNFKIIIIGRREYTQEMYRSIAREWLFEHARFNVTDELADTFLSYVHYFKMVFTELEGYLRLKDFYKECQCSGENLIYFAVAPTYFTTIAENLEASGLVHNSKIIIEKPFGDDLHSAQKIEEKLTEIFGDKVFRIDHYVAKEMVQNIHTIRFANTLFKDIWDNHHIENIQISANELVGVESRGNYYDQTGALKDMFQNHILQILSIVAMDPPKDDSVAALHHEQEKVLDSLYIDDYNNDIVWGQYTENEDSLAYRDEKNVDRESQTETYVALKLGLNMNRWENTPIYVRTGKRMNNRSTEVIIEFKSKDDIPSNVLVIKIQPEEGIYLRFNIKKPGQENLIETVYMDFCQSCIVHNRLNTPEAYERLLNSAMEDDMTLFVSYKQVEASWTFVENITRHSRKAINFYPAYTDGPVKAHDLLAKNNHKWIESQSLEALYRNLD